MQIEDAVGSEPWVSVTHDLSDRPVMRVIGLLTVEAGQGAFVHNGVGCTLDEGVSISFDPRQKRITVQNGAYAISSDSWGQLGVGGKWATLDRLVRGAARNQGILVKTEDEDG